MAQVDEVAELVRDGVPAALRVGGCAHEDVAVLFRLVLNQPALEGIRVERLDFEDAAGERDIDDGQRQQLGELRRELQSRSSRACRAW